MKSYKFTITYGTGLNYKNVYKDGNNLRSAFNQLNTVMQRAGGILFNSLWVPTHEIKSVEIEEDANE